MKRVVVVVLGLISGLLLAGAPSSVLGAKPSYLLLPKTTKAYVSVPNVDLLREKFNATQLGALANDPLMKPFIEDLRQQLESRFGRTELRLNLKLEDLKDVYGGELCLAMIQPGGDEKQHALVLLVDISGHEKQAGELLDRIAKDLAAKGASRSVQTIQGVQLITYVLPKKRGETESQRAFYFIHDNELVASDHEATIKEIIPRFFASKEDELARLAPFVATMNRSQKSVGPTVPHLRWFVEPFGYVETVRAASGGRQRRGTDLLKVLKNQGFTAIQGIGGFVFFSTDGREMMHRSFVYAPPVAKAPDKYKLAARMLDFPNDSELQPEIWIPRTVSNYLSLHWKMKEAFEYSKTLVDEVAGAPVFEDILESLKKDPNGPRVDIREGLVKHLGQRVIFTSDYQLPVEPTSERWLLAFQITNPAVVAQTLDKAMGADPDAKARVVGKQKVWEIQRKTEEADVEELDISGAGLSVTQEEDDEEESAPLLNHAALTVSQGYLMVASHLDFLEQILNRSGADSVAQAKDFIRIQDSLTKLGAGKSAARFFVRTDKAYHMTYELVRQGKMPEADTLLGNALNGMFGPEERGVLREQQIKGDKLPEFEKIRQYFGPAGLFIESEADGWLISGCLLTRQEGDMEVAGAMVSRPTNERR